MPERKITILHMIETTGPGGAETVLLNIIKGLNPTQFESIVTLKGKGWLYDSLEAAGTLPLIVESSGAIDWRFLREIVRVVKARKVELIHSHLPDSNFYACIAGLLSGAPVIATFHGMVGAWSSRSLKNRIKMVVIRSRARSVVAVSDFLKKEMIRDWSFRESQLTRIYNGVDFAKFESFPGVEAVKSEFGIPPTATLICAVGNIRRPKGYEFLLRAASDVVQSGRDACFLIVGQGQGQLLDELIKLRNSLGLEARVIFAGFREDVPAILKASDIFVLSSVTEGLSIATIEAMGLGKAVVVTDSGGPAEIVEHNDTGLLVPPRDAKALAAAMLRLIEDRELAVQLGGNARLAVREKFGIEANIRNYVDLYRNCLR